MSRQQFNVFGFCQATLCVYIKRTDRLDLIIKELHAIGVIAAHRE